MISVTTTTHGTSGNARLARMATKMHSLLVLIAVLLAAQLFVVTGTIIVVEMRIQNAMSVIERATDRVRETRR
jgi:hypothetical protein